MKRTAPFITGGRGAIGGRGVGAGGGGEDEGGGTRKKKHDKTDR